MTRKTTVKHYTMHVADLGFMSRLAEKTIVGHIINDIKGFKRRKFDAYRIMRKPLKVEFFRINEDNKEYQIVAVVDFCGVRFR